MRVKYAESCALAGWLAGWGGEGGEKGREGWRGDRGREAKSVCVVLQPIVELRHLSRSHNHCTLCYISTRTHTTILLFDPCHDLSALCQSFSIDEGREDNRRRRREGHQEGQPLIDNASRLVTSHTPTYLITSPGKHTHLVSVVPTSLSEVPSKKRGESSETACTLPSRSSCRNYHIGPCSRYPRELLLQRCT